MKDKIQAVKEFHKAFKLDYLEQPKANIGLEKNKLRFNLMREENEEYLEAANKNDIIETVAEKILNSKDLIRVTDDNNSVVGSINPSKVIKVLFGG